MQSDARRILSSVTFFGPVPLPDAVVQAIGASQTDIDLPLHWGVNGVWTAPEARRRGLGLALMGMAKQWAADQAAAQGRDCVVTTIVYETNKDAIGFYQRSGFAVCGGGEPGKLQMMLRQPRDGSAL